MSEAATKNEENITLEEEHMRDPCSTLFVLGFGLIVSVVVIMIMS